jgi:hypothetical protein
MLAHQDNPSLSEDVVPLNFHREPKFELEISVRIQKETVGLLMFHS